MIFLLIKFKRVGFYVLKIYICKTKIYIILNILEIYLLLIYDIKSDWKQIYYNKF